MWSGFSPSPVLCIILKPDHFFGTWIRTTFEILKEYSTFCQGHDVIWSLVFFLISYLSVSHICLFSFADCILLMYDFVSEYLNPCHWTSDNFSCYHDMATLSSLLGLCEGNPPIAGGFPSQSASKIELWFLCVFAWTSCWTISPDASYLEWRGSHMTVMLTNILWGNVCRHVLANANQRVTHLSSQCFLIIVPDSKIHGANMGPTWVLLGPMLAPCTLLSGCGNSLIILKSLDRHSVISPLSVPSALCFLSYPLLMTYWFLANHRPGILS